MRILIYSHAFAPQIGGVETIVMTQAVGFAQMNASAQIQVTIVTQTPKGEFVDESLPFLIIRKPTFVRLVKLIREADLIHFAGPVLLPMVLAWALRKDWSIEHYGFQTICPNGQMVQQPGDMPCPGHFMAHRHLRCLKCYAEGGPITTARIWLLTFVRRWIARKATVNIVPTGWLGEQLKLPRTVTIHLGLNPPSTYETTKRQTGPPTFFFLGRLVPTKGVRVLVAAACRLLKAGVLFRLKIAGDGPERQRLVGNVEAAGLTGCVKFLGKVSDEEAGVEMGQAIATVMPSLGGETFGLVALESMMRGCTVITSDLGSLREVVGNTGMSFPVGDDRELAMRMSDLANSRETAAELGQRARLHALQKFKSSRMISEHCRLFESIVKKHRTTEIRK